MPHPWPFAAPLIPQCFLRARCVSARAVARHDPSAAPGLCGVGCGARGLHAAAHVPPRPLVVFCLSAPRGCWWTHLLAGRHAAAGLCRFRPSWPPICPSGAYLGSVLWIPASVCRLLPCAVWSVSGFWISGWRVKRIPPAPSELEGVGFSFTFHLCQIWFSYLVSRRPSLDSRIRSIFILPSQLYFLQGDSPLQKMDWARRIESIG